ncbi:MAG: hypothetical protein IMZ65_02405, partial [Planctomycetes bacterium]|nr:hypothetical protein [Planctomycetota bacterium]
MDWKVGLAIFLFTWTLTTHGKYSVSGDEPHYLMITHSVLVDHDMDVANNYANNDGRFFGHDGLDMGLHAVPALNGHVRPIHNVGLAVGLVPVYAVARTLAALPSESILARFRMGRGLFAYSIVSIFLIAVTVHGLLLLGQGLVEVTGNARIAALLMAAAGISPPIVSHSFLVFPEVPALYVTCLAVWISLKAPAAADRIALMGVALVLGLLPWTHNKYLVYVPGLLWLIVWKRPELVRSLSMVERTVGLALFVLPQVGLQLWMWREWGTLGGALTMSALPFSIQMLGSGLPGLLLDRQSGLLAYAPLYWLVPACWYLTRRNTWPFLVPAALLYVPAAAFTIGWWAGFSPAARYIVPLTPIWLVVIAGALVHRPIRAAAGTLLVFQVLIDGVVWQRPRTLWSSMDRNPALDALGWLGRSYE